MTRLSRPRPPRVSVPPLAGASNLTGPSGEVWSRFLDSIKAGANSHQLSCSLGVSLHEARAGQSGQTAIRILFHPVGCEHFNCCNPHVGWAINNLPKSYCYKHSSVKNKPIKTILVLVIREFLKHEGHSTRSAAWKALVK